eukprot:Cvel_26166.t1-p1 / transcript=Cvel_26166.t1 / gene=Cvel_26166 / organism=Chromera_velia_CCMP2878 / gene_product=Splicing factor 3B subunit 4, putative / transcript_product=Splicing factor 3B subunit 4, putative / location=Cvel_scaffold3073:15022-19728(+) / protein_length=428 / sequence_SO=supercontig / SO=protein_coding / is_pseudo=false
MAAARGNIDISQIYERNQEATLYIGNLEPKVDEETLGELFTQCGPVKSVSMPRDKITQTHQSYGFIEFEHEEDANYALRIMGTIKLYGRPIKLNKASQDKRTVEVGANLFVGNLDPEVDDKMLHMTFASFGTLLSVKIMRDPETGESKGFGFVAFDTFEASDGALAAMNGQFLCNRPIHVSYAYKKDTKGERHGTAAERLLAANRPKTMLASMQAANAQASSVPTPLADQPQIAAPNSVSAVGPFSAPPLQNMNMPMPMGAMGGGMPGPPPLQPAGGLQMPSLSGAAASMGGAGGGPAPSAGTGVPGMGPPSVPPPGMGMGGMVSMGPGGGPPPLPASMGGSGMQPPGSGGMGGPMGGGMGGPMGGRGGNMMGMPPPLGMGGMGGMRGGPLGGPMGGPGPGGRGGMGGKMPPMGNMAPPFGPGGMGGP